MSRRRCGTTRNMPGQPLWSLSPVAATRAALQAVLDGGSPAPLLDAAGLLIAACEEATRSDPEWADFLARVSGGPAHDSRAGAPGRPAQRGPRTCRPRSSRA